MEMNGAKSVFSGSDGAVDVIAFDTNYKMTYMTGPLGHLPEHQLFEILQKKLNSNPCRNQGFVLDGFPNTYDQAKCIFSGKIFFFFHLCC